MRTWGTKKNKPVITIHGAFDNLAAFNKLIPLLPSTFYYICIDLPHHGLSSPITNFYLLDSLQFVFSIKLVLNYFKRDKYIVLAHSYGAGLAQLLVRLYPDLFEKMISMDGIVLREIPVKYLGKYVKSVLNNFLEKFETSKQNNQYTKEESIHLVQNMRLVHPLQEDMARMLVERCPIDTSKYRYSLLN